MSTAIRRQAYKVITATKAVCTLLRPILWYFFSMMLFTGSSSLNVMKQNPLLLFVLFSMGSSIDSTWSHHQWMFKLIKWCVWRINEQVPTCRANRVVPLQRHQSILWLSPRECLERDRRRRSSSRAPYSSWPWLFWGRWPFHWACVPSVRQPVRENHKSTKRVRKKK